MIAILEFLYWLYFLIATIIFFVELTKDKDFFIVLIGYFFGGALFLLIPILPVFLIYFIPDDYLIFRQIVGTIYLVLLNLFCLRYFIYGYLKSESKVPDKVFNNSKNILNESNTKDERTVIWEGFETTKEPENGTKVEVKKLYFVNYNLKLSQREKNFPILKIPSQNCVVRSHQYGSTKRRGVKEASFQKSIEYYFAEHFEISGNVILITGKNLRPYEPDIAIIGSDAYNIRIDIEIDEPYAGITRQPIHCVGDDIHRDNYFRDRGWIVIRFSEYQIHTQEKNCLKYIAEIISSINSSIEIPADLKYIPRISSEKVWTVAQAQKWEKEKYRENYLKLEFQRIGEETKEILKRDFVQQEIEEEKLVKPTQIGKVEIRNNIGFNTKNKHERDNRIKFYKGQHIYTVDGVVFPSASTIVSRFFKKFDPWEVANNLNPNNPLFGLEVEEIVRIWNERNQDATNSGTFLHEQIENFYLNKPYEHPAEFYQFENFVNDHPNLKPYRSEWRVFDDTIGIAGTIDLIANNQQNFDIYDWKRSKKVINPIDGSPIKKDHWGKFGVGQLAHIDDTSFNRYCLQQSLYKFILEKNYNLKVDNMYLIIMHPEYNYYYKEKVPYLKTEIEHILKTV